MHKNNASISILSTLSYCLCLHIFSNYYFWSKDPFLLSPLIRIISLEPQNLNNALRRVLGLNKLMKSNFRKNNFVAL